MKLLCLLLTVYVLVLSIRPCCSDNNCQAKVADEIAGSHTPVKEKGCLGCSPFFTCGSCVWFILAKPYSAALPISTEVKVEHNACYKPSFLAQITLAIWQPPKIS